jgi:hypothetical protein
MRKAGLFLCIAITMAVSLLGCTKMASNETPDCNSDQTKAMVLKKVFLKTMNSTVQQREGRNYLDSEDALKGFSGEFKDPRGNTVKYRYSGGVLDVIDGDEDFRIGLQNIKTVSIDKSMGKYSCTAQVTNDFYKGVRKTDAGSITTISYTSAAGGKGPTVEIK